MRTLKNMILFCIVCALLITVAAESANAESDNIGHIQLPKYGLFVPPEVTMNVIENIVQIYSHPSIYNLEHIGIPVKKIIGEVD